LGKISDALDRASKEKIISLGECPQEEPKKLTPEDPETVLVKDICKINGCNEKLVVLSAPSTPDAENFKLLRGQILYPRDRQRPKTIMVSSAYPAEGKTFVAANLAVSIALSIDESVLLIDCDLRNPEIHKLFNYQNLEGLHEYLTGQKSLQELIVRTEIKKLSLLMAGSIPSNPSELLSSTAMQSFLKEVRERYQDRLIVIDSPPSLNFVESKILAERFYGTILVVMAHRSPRKAIKNVIQNIGKEKILGIIFNGHNQARKVYNRHYGKYYMGK
jgi:protein-tyrosine kinase